ncbi:MAG: cell division protein FtsA [Bacteroidota bacterium]
MNPDQIVVGIDIGTTKICTAVGRMNEHGKLDILGIGYAASEGVAKGMVSNIEKTGLNIIAGVKAAEEASGVDISLINVGISCPKIRVAPISGNIIRNNSQGTISVEDVERLRTDQSLTVLPSGNKIIHMLPQEYRVDGDEPVSDPVGMSGVKLEAAFHVIMAHNMAISHTERSLTRAGLEIKSMIFGPLAAAMAVLTEEEKEGGVVLVDIGAGKVDLAVFHQGIVRHTAVIPLAGNVITSDIKTGLGLLDAQAEYLKVNFGGALPEDAEPNGVVEIEGIRGRAAKQVSEEALVNIVHCRMAEILAYVHNEIIFSGYEQQLNMGIVLTGGGAQLRNVKYLCEYITGIDTRIGYPNEHLGSTKGEDLTSPANAVAIGLVLAGFRNFDAREDRYDVMRKSPKPKTNSNGKPAAVAAEKPKTSLLGGFFSSIVDKTRNLLLDDDDLKQNY